MLKSHLLLAWRNVFRRKTFSIINIIGLSIALAFSLVIFLWIENERSFDAFHSNGARLYRVIQTQYYADGKINSSDRTPSMLAAALPAEVAGISRSVNMSGRDSYTLKVGNKLFRETGASASEEFFEVFSFPILRGNPSTCLMRGDQIAISRKLSLKYYGTIESLGKTIQVDNGDSFYVSAIFDDVPHNSSLQFDFLLSFKQKENLPWVKDWAAIGDLTFVLLDQYADAGSVDAHLHSFLKTRLPNSTDKLSLQPYNDMYLHSNFTNGVPDGGRIDYVRAFSAIVLLILAIACINFMNLATAQTLRRARQIGIRKVVGAARGTIIRQYLVEAVLMAWLALIFSLILVQLILPQFNLISGKQLMLRFSDPYFLLLLVVLATSTGLIAGSYPAFYLSGLNPLRVLKGVFRLNYGFIDLRKALVTFQFCISIVFIVVSLIVFQQLRYIQNKNLGLDKTNLVQQLFEGALTKNFSLFKNELLNAPGIESVTYSNQPVLDIQHSSTWIEWPGMHQEVLFAFAGIGFDFTETMKIELLAGRDFSPLFMTDSANVLVNEEAVRQMGLIDPVGHEITTLREIARKGKIIGVMKDFHHKSLHSPIEPICLFLDTTPGFGVVTVRTSPGKIADALTSMETANKKYNPDFPLAYTFVDKEFQSKYESELLLSELSGAFSFLTIFISCLGLFGLAAFTADQRTREIGIRKILGASLTSIVRLISFEFIVVVLIAFLIGVPVAWFLGVYWLDSYPYRIAMSWWLICGTGAGALIVACLTVGAQAIKAGMQNPVSSLRSD